MNVGNAGIRRRIYVGFGVVLALLVAEVGVALRGLHRIDRLRHEIADEIDPPARAAEDLERTVLGRAIAARNFVASGDGRFRADHDAGLERSREALERLSRSNLDPENRNRLNTIQRLADEHAAATEAFLGLFERGAEADSVSRADRRVTALRQRLLDGLHEFQAAQRVRQRIASVRSEELQRDVTSAMLATAVLVGVALGVTAVLTVRAVRRPALALVRAAQALEAGDHGPALAFVDGAVGPGSGRSGELRQLGAAFARMADALQRREARLAADGRLGAALAMPLDPEATAASALREVVAYAGTELATVYAVEADGLNCVATHGASGAPEFLERDGLVAQVLETGHAAIVSPIPPDLPFALSAGFGDIRPRTVMALPLCARGERVGVMLLGSLGDLDGDAAGFAERAAGHLAIALQNAISHRALGALASELKTSNERLQAQNEALQEQGREIQAQTSELQAQAAEIRCHRDELAEAKDALAAKADALEEADRRKNEFLATLGHELRNPLAAVAAAGRLLEAGAADGSTAARHAAMVARQVRHLRRLVDDLLDLSRINHGKFELRVERVDLRGVVEQAVETAAANALEKSVRISVQLSDRAARVDADTTRLDQVLSNVFQNAIKYSPSGGTITVRVGAEGTGAVIRVRDGGTGIPGELLPRIFEPFIQGVHSEGGETGLGLGLTLVRRLVEMHGGSVEARSDGPGKGTELVIGLPLAEVAAEDDVVPAGGFHDRDMRLRVLVVEDNPDVAETMCDALELFGYAVRVARDAEEGLAACLESPPDVGLFDIGLPGRSGYDLARDVRARFPRDAIRLLAVTGYGQPEDRARAEEAGFDHHLVKPVELEELRRVIEHLAFHTGAGAAA